MCPACLTSLLLTAAGVGSAGGVTAFLARTLLRPRTTAPLAGGPGAAEADPGTNQPERCEALAAARPLTDAGEKP